MGYRYKSAYRMRKLAAAFAKADRESVLRSQGGRCKYCLDPLSYKTVTRDHVIPRVNGGTDARDNLVAACFRCNQSKGSLPMKKFVRLIQNPQRGEPIIYRLIWFDWRLNKALIKMERRVFRAAGIRE